MNDVVENLPIIKELYLSNKITVKDIAKKFGVSKTTIYENYIWPFSLKRNISLLRKHSNGYIMLNDEYLHRRVMAEYLGRKLRKEDLVHHINGNKRDNRIENLMIVDRVGHGVAHTEKKPLLSCQKCHGKFIPKRTRGKIGLKQCSTRKYCSLRCMWDAKMK